MCENTTFWFEKDNNILFGHLVWDRKEETEKRKEGLCNKVEGKMKLKKKIEIGRASFL